MEIFLGLSESSGFPQQQRINQRVLNLLKNPLINVFNPEYIIQLLNKDSLMKIQQFMRKNKTFKMTSFMRFFREVLPFDKSTTNSQQQFFIFHALFKLFQQICNSKKKVEITFSDISSYMAEKMPNFVQQNLIKQKLLPFGLDIDQQLKPSIISPQVYGQINQDHCFLTERPIKSDRIQHMGRDVGQSQYSKKHKIFISIDKPSVNISILDKDLNIIQNLKTEQQMSKRDMIVNYIAWSERQQKIACILGNYSISMWSKQDNYKYQVNIPLPHQYLNHPFVMIKYMDSIKKWITLDNRPVIYVLRPRDYEPDYSFDNIKIRKKKQAQKTFITQLHYLQLLCLGFQRNLFLINLKNRQIVTQLHNFRTSITSLVFSQSYQALFISTYEMYFRSFELSQYQDLIQKGKFQGHKSQISLLGVIQPKPVVFSLQQSSILKMFNMLDCTCYQSISVLKNILYKQVLYLQDAICLVGSKMHIYGLHRELTYEQKQNVLYISTHHKNLIVITNKCIRIYNIHNGALKSVIKTVFDQSTTNNNNIYSAYYMQTKQKLMIQNQQGQCLILQTKQMNQIQKWHLDPKPIYMHYDEQNDLLTQVSLGNIYINQFHNQFCQKELRRQITNQKQVVRFVKVCIEHDLIVVCYYGDDSMYFYAYEKGKMLGHLYFGEKKVVKFKNAYRPRKDIERIVGIQFYQNKNLIFLVLSDELLVMTYKRTLSSMTFLIKKSIKLWQNPIKLKDNSQYIYSQQQLQQPLHSTGVAVFQKHVTVTSNKVNLLATISYQIQKICELQNYVINKDNYNPHRIGNQIHTGSQFRNPMVTIKDQTGAVFELAYFAYKKKLGDFVMCEQVGNLLSIADNLLNIVLLQSPNWSQIAGIINCKETLPKLWNIFMYSKQEVQEVQFVLKFVQNQDKIPDLSLVKSLMQASSKIDHSVSQSFVKITISQLIQQDKAKNHGLKGYRSSSLREKKMVLQKERDQKDKLQQFLEKQRKQKKQNPNPTLKDNAQKQINDTLGYLSFNHNDTILNKGIVDEQYPVVKLLEKKLLSSISKEEKKSLVSFQSGESSIKSHKKLDKADKVDQIPIREISQPNFTKTLSTEIYEGMTERLGLRKYNSRQLIETLHLQKVQSQRKLKSVSKLESKLPKIYKG